MALTQYGYTHIMSYYVDKYKKYKYVVMFFRYRFVAIVALYKFIDVIFKLIKNIVNPSLE